MQTATLPKSEELLVDYTQRLGRHRAHRHALWFMLSALARENRHESDIQLAANLLLPFARKYQGELFTLSSGDIVVCTKKPDRNACENITFDVQFSFSHDPLMRRADTEGTGVFVTAYDMDKDYDTFLARVTGLAKGIEASPPSRPATATSEARHIIHKDQNAKPPRAERLPGHVQTPQGRIAIERMLRLSEIALWDGQGKYIPWGVREGLRTEAIDAFESLALAIARQQVDQRSALSEIERLILPMLPDHLERRQGKPQILALHQDALMSTEFLTFDREMQQRELDRPIIGFFQEDIRSDPETVQYLVPFLAGRSYRLALTGAQLRDIHGLQALPECAFVQLNHSFDFEPKDLERLSAVLKAVGPEKLILSDISTRPAAQAAREAGVKLMSGPIIDVLL